MKYVKNRTGIFAFNTGFYQDISGTHQLSVPCATFKVESAIVQQARDKGLNSLPLIIQEYLADKSKDMV